MSHTSDYKQLGAEGEAQEDDSSFASWLPPLLKVEPTPGAPPATLTGLGPASAPRASLFPPSVPGMDDDAAADAAALAAELERALDDEDDEPTRVISQLFPGLAPRPRARSSESPPRALASGSGTPPPPIISAPTTESTATESPSPESPESPESLATPASSTPNADGPALAEDREPAAAEETELLALILESSSKRSAPPPVRISEPAVVIAESVAFSVQDLPIPTAPGLELYSVERERPTSPSARKFTPPSETLPRVTPLRSDPPWAATVRPNARPRSRAAVRIALFAFAASALLTVLILRALMPGKGSVLVTATGSMGMPVENAQVLVDGTVACSPVPCRVNQLKAGRHSVTVKAPGYQPLADKTLTVAAGEEALIHFGLTPEDNAGLHVRLKTRGIRVSLNGEDRGEAPLTLGGLPPGEHTVRFTGSAYAPFEQKVTLKPNAVLTLTPELLPLQAVIAIQAGPGLEHAAVEVIGGPQRKAVVDLPARIEVAANGKYLVRATRPGYQDYEAEVTFAEGETEKEVRIELRPAHAAGSPGWTQPNPVVLEESVPRSNSAGTLSPSGAGASPSGAGTLSLNSIPISSVLVNGRPVGSTPRQIQLPPGSHSVIFVHPKLGRKSMNVNVLPGKTAIAATRF